MILHGAAQVNSSPSDEELIRRTLAGEKECFRLLVERHQQMLFGVLFRQVGNRNVAAELTQEALVKAYLALEQFRFKSAFSSWLVRIGSNTACSYFSSRAYREQLRQESFSIEKHDLTQPEYEADETDHRLRCFRRAFATLRAPFQEVLTLCALEGGSYEEAAAALEIPIGTVRSRLNSARLKLKAALQKELTGGAHDDA